MEVLDQELLRRFLAVDAYCSGFGYGDGYDAGSGCGTVSGNGYGFGFAKLNEYRDGSGGNGDGSGSGDGYGDRDGSGDGYGDGYGSGSYNGYGLQEFDGKTVHYIDDLPTLIESVRDCGGFLVASGRIISKDLTTKPTYVVRIGDSFAHGYSISEAHTNAREKFLEARPIETRIADFVATHPDLDTPYGDLFSWHHILTGSCKQGREEWCREHDLQPTDSITVRRFINETKGNYGGDIIRQLALEYNLTTKRRRRRNDI